MKRFYVTMTWDDFPEGGSYGDIFEAEDTDQAEHLCMFAMAESRCEAAEEGEPESFPSWWMDPANGYCGDWHVIDCFDLDEFIVRHAAGAADIHGMPGHD